MKTKKPLLIYLVELVAKHQELIALGIVTFSIGVLVLVNIYSCYVASL